MGNPRVSVVINTYNRARRLPATLEGLDRQSYRNFEVIVVNGPSTDDTSEVLYKFGSRIRVGLCPVAKLGVSRNIGLDLAAAEIVAFIDDDAVPRESWLENLVRGYDDPIVAGVGGYVFNGIRNCMEWKLCVCTRLGVPDMEAPPPVERYLGKGAEPFLYLPGCNMSFRRDMAIEVGGFDERYAQVYDDSEICCRIIDAGYRLAVRDDAVVDHYPASNRDRDAQGQSRDPYNWLYAQTDFATRYARGRYSERDLYSELDRLAAEYRAIGSALLDRGILSADEFTVYLDRVEHGMRDGTTGAGAAPEPPERIFLAHRPERFQPYLPVQS